ncbi:MAG TPA: hypothetical protein VGK23_01090 [Methanomassiliicoccales archaeon]|jgi:hypothetical protein
MSREWEEIPCPECGAENIVKVEAKGDIKGRWKINGEKIVFVYGSHAIL